MSHLLKLPCGFFDNRSGGDLATRLSAISLIREVLASGGTAMALDALFVVSYFVAMAALLPRMTLVVVAIALLQVALLVVLVPRVRALTGQELAAQPEAQGYAIEALHAISLVKSTAVEGPTFERWSGLWQGRWRQPCDGPARARY